MTLQAITAQLRKGYEPYFLVECNFDGYYDRITNRTVSVYSSVGDAKLFDGKMLNAITYGPSFSFDNFKYNIGSVQVYRNNADRFQDQETRRRLDGGICTVYIWCEGLTWEQINPYGIIMRGSFEKSSHTKYEYIYSINEFSKSDKYGLVPKITINDDTWPLHRKFGGAGSVSGQFVPILFGDAGFGAVAKCVDTSTDYMYVVTSGISKSVDADYIALTENVHDNAGIVINAGNYEVRTTVDGLGNPVTLIDFTGNYASEEPISCSMQGITDGSGEYTGTAGTLLEHPSDIIHYLIDNFGSKAVDYVDLETFKSFKSVYPSLKCCFQITEQISITEIIGNLLGQASSAQLARLGGYQGIMIFDIYKGVSARLIQNQVQIGKTAVFSKTAERNLCNKLEVQYGYNYAMNQYQKTLFRNKENNVSCKQSYLQYGAEYEKTIQLPYVHDENTAGIIASTYVDVYAFRHDVMSWSVPLFEGLEIRRGDVAMITCDEGPSASGAGWSQEPCILVEKKYKKNMIEQTWWKIAT